MTKKVAPRNRAVIVHHQMTSKLELILVPPTITKINWGGDSRYLRFSNSLTLLVVSNRMYSRLGTSRGSSVGRAQH